ncbi:Protein of unknown function DUF88 [Lachnospiraceae bacterium JC7]|nr:Protein of unknown function DUF88 [Lachnospiraceae bacterium JC7]
MISFSGKRLKGIDMIDIRYCLFEDAFLCQGIQREGRNIIGMSEYIYSNDVDSFVLVSSDSDYWGLMEALPEANFLVMVEHEKCSYALKEELIQHGIFYCCYIDDFQS